MAEGFFGRWSQRKLAERQGKPPAEAATPVGRREPAPDAPPPAAAAIAAPADERKDDGQAGAQADVPAPTMADVAGLHKDSDFKPFVARAVQPEVRNAALKKLFADPHFNVMDGLDTYIDDYSKPDPLPLSMLRQMASAKFLQLFDDDDDDKQPADDRRPALPDCAVREDANSRPPIGVAQSGPGTDDSHTAPPAEPDTTEPHNDDTDLRLQPDDAAGPAGPGRVAE